MKILQVNYYDNLGGAARIAWLLHQSYQNRNHESWMIVGKRFSNDPFIYSIPDSLPHSWFSIFFNFLSKYSDNHKLRLFNYPVSSYINRLADPIRYFKRNSGKEDFLYPNSRKLFDLCPSIPEIVHFHNLHLNYFDLTFLPELSLKQPTVVTLHDMWLLTGHCAYSTNCNKWKTGCGNCPHLDSYPAMSHDQTAYNWQRKQDLYSRSQFYLTGPSKWMVQTAKESILAPAIIKSKVIPNGIDLNSFSLGDKTIARDKLSLPHDSIILLFVSASGVHRSSYKDYETINKVINILTSKIHNQKIILIALGEKEYQEIYGNCEIRHLSHINSMETMAKYYQAADIYLHAAKAESFGLVIAEAQACGTPVVATSIGGIPEIIVNGETGFLTQPENPEEMSEKVMQLIANKPLRESMGIAASKFAQENFSLDKMVNGYLDFYKEILEDQKI